MPEPADNESRDDFVARCVPIVLEDGTAEDQAQAVAICQSMFDDKSHEMVSDDRCVDMHNKFVEQIRQRLSSKEPFGYGITTAEPYVRHLLAMEDAGCKTGRTMSPESLLKEAAMRLCVASEDMVVEKLLVGDPSEDKDNAFAGVQAPPNTLMLIRHVLTTDREDRDGDILRTAGAKLDPKAPLLWQHQPFLPIGRVMQVVEQTANKLTVVSALLDLNELTGDAAKLFEADALRFSHGFSVRDYEQRKDDDGNEMDGFDVKEFDIYEGSAVSVPSNIDAEVELYSRGKLESELVKAHAKQLFDKRPVQVTGSDCTKQVDDEQIVLDDDTNADDADIACVKEFKTTTEEVAEIMDAIADESVDIQKSGRTLSQRNLETLEEVMADLTEMGELEALPRSAKALCDRCISRLSGIIDAAKPAEDEEKDAKEMKPAVVPEIADVVNFVLGASEDDLARVQHTINLLVNINAYHVAGEDYRHFEQQM